MIKILLFIISTSLSIASGTHVHSNVGPNKIPKIYNQYKLANKVKKAASAVYLCTCGDQVWKQDASKVKACPYCGPAMPNCGLLVKVLPKRGEKYDWSDYDLPNKICPITNEEIDNTKHKVELEGHTVLVCCKKCVSKLKRAIAKGKVHKKLRKLPLKPEKFGFLLKHSDHKH